MVSCSLLGGLQMDLKRKDREDAAVPVVERETAAVTQSHDPALPTRPISEEVFAIRDGLWDWDIRGDVVVFSPGNSGESEFRERETMSRSRWYSAVHAADMARVEQAIAAHLARKTPRFSCEFRARCEDGEFRWHLSRGRAVVDRDGRPSRMVGALSLLANKKTYDPVTGLPGRASVDRLGKALLLSARERNHTLGVLIIGVDPLRAIAETFGQSVGDDLIREVAARVSACLRPTDLAGRISNDELVVLMEPTDNSGGASALAEQILRSTRRNYDARGVSVWVSTSIGIAYSSLDEESPTDVIHRAGVAMRRSRDRGGGRKQVYADGMEHEVSRTLKVQGALSRAIDGQTPFQVHYQPIVRLGDGQIVGFEALIRWHDPALGWVSPAEFVPLAERTGLIVPIGAWVLEQVCSTLGRLRMASSHSLTVSVNFSGVQLADPTLVDLVAEVLDRTGCDPSWIKVEITESAIMERPGAAAEILGRMREMGMKLNIDDFGTGYSSLSYLHRFPVDGLKIDKSFVSAIADSEHSRAVVRTILALARELGLLVTAEGIETGEQLETLRVYGCHLGQGYYFSKALAAEEAEALLVETPRGKGFMGLRRRPKR